MSFQNNFGKLREWGRKAVLPTQEMKKLLKKNIFDQCSINKVIDFGAGTLYWSKWFSKIVGAKNVYPVDVVFQNTKPKTNMKYFTSIDDVPTKEHKNLFFICDVIHHLHPDVWNHVKNKVFSECDMVVIKDVDCNYKFKNFMAKLHDRIINGKKIYDIEPKQLMEELKTSGYIYIYITFINCGMHIF